MRQILFCLLFCLSGLFRVLAQDVPGSAANGNEADSVQPFKPVPAGDTVQTDSSLVSAIIDSTISNQDSSQYRDSLVQEPVAVPPPPEEPRHDAVRKKFQGKESYFYVLIGLILSFGLIRQAFPKYFNDFLRVFLRRTLKQKQLYEQMVQTPVPSLLLNLFFVVVAGLYVSYLLDYFDLVITDNFWIQFLYCAGIIAALYILKFAGMKFLGWMLNYQAAADEYIFAVFLISKAIAIFLLPCLVFLLLSRDQIASFILMLSFIGTGLLFLNRLYLSFQILHNRVKVSLFHFLLFILAFEIIPLFLIYKLLLLVF
jgi:hypothetical protein